MLMIPNDIFPATVRLHETLPALAPDAPRARALVDTDALAANYRTLLGRVRSVSPATQGIAVVKADAYGHTIRLAVPALLAAGCRAFAVACLAEAVALRQLLRELLPDEAEPMILVLGYTDPAHISILANFRVTATLLSDGHAMALETAAVAAGVTVKVHAALDTGMNRVGYPAHTDREIAETAVALATRFCHAPGGPGLCLDGLFTHFAKADEDYDTEMRSPDSLTERQFDRYRRVLEGLIARGLRPRLCHICNSAAAVRFPAAHPDRLFDAVRLGINLYGYGVLPTDDLFVRPTLRLVTRVAHVHDLLPYETVGYGGTFTSDTPRRLVTLPVGYADGWIRAFTGASVTLHTPHGDHAAPVVGRICMDQCMVDITDLPAEAGASVVPGTPVTLFGQSNAELDALAARAHTISYELLCLITARVGRAKIH